MLLQNSRIPQVLSSIFSVVISKSKHDIKYIMPKSGKLFRQPTQNIATFFSTLYDSHNHILCHFLCVSIFPPSPPHVTLFFYKSFSFPKASARVSPKKERKKKKRSPPRCNSSSKIDGNGVVFRFKIWFRPPPCDGVGDNQPEPSLSPPPPQI